jgi:hypothetical protein
MPTGRGSVVLGATGPLGAIAQIQARSPQVPSFGAYTAFTAGSSNVYVPLVAKNGSSASGLANSQIVVQNTGTSNVTFAIDFKGTPNFTLSGLTVPGKTSRYIDVTTVGGLPNNWFGAATVRATNPTSGLLAVVSNLFFGPNAMQTFNGIPSTDAGVKWLNPSFFARLSNGLSSVMTVQNVSGSQIAIGGIQASCKETQSNTGQPTLNRSNTTAVPNGGSYSFNPVTDASIPAGWIGACTISTPGKNTVAFVQLRYVGVPTDQNAAFTALKGNGTNKKVIIPLIAKRLSNGFATVATVQNLGGSQTQVTFVYKHSPTESAVKQDFTVGPYPLAGGASLQHNHRVAGPGGNPGQPTVHNLPDGWVGSLTVTSSSQPIDGYAQLTFTNAGAGDNFQAHNAFTQP